MHKHKKLIQVVLRGNRQTVIGTFKLPTDMQPHLKSITCIKR